MTNSLRHSVWIYQKLLFLYPEALRREFGGEMTLAFAEDMEGAWRDGRVAGVIHVWWWALRELLTVALPGQRSNPYVLVPALSFALVALVQSAELCVAFHQARRVESFMLFDAIRFTVLLPSIISALEGLVVTRLAAHCSITALQLD